MTPYRQAFCAALATIALAAGASSTLAAQGPVETDPAFQVSGIIGDQAFIKSEERSHTLLHGEVVSFRGDYYQVKISGQQVQLLPLFDGGRRLIFEVSSGNN